MTLDIFFKKFDQFAAAPNAVAKMRVLVLQLAVQGKLVSQNPKDEKASILLARIGKTKEVLISDRKIRRQETAPIDGTEVLFSIPQSWIWTRLGEIAEWGSGSTPSRGNSDLYDGGIAWLKSGELNDNQALAGSEETITEKALKTGSFRRNKPGDVLLAMYGATIGKVAILAEPAVTNQAVCGCTPFDGVFNRYLFSYLLSQRARFHSASEGGAQPNISKVKIVAFPFPLPPLAEQKRIVAKVDELMALCDRLEAQQQEREAQSSALACASLARFAQAPTPANLNLLFHKSYSITPADLRKAILTLAVRGKLLPQNPKDEHAATLLEKVHQSRRALAAQGVLKTKVDLASVGAKAEPYSIPGTWVWVPLNELTELVYGKLLPTKDLLSEGFLVFGANGIIGKHSKYHHESEMLLISCRGAYSGKPNISPPKCYVTNNSIVCEFFEPQACDIRFYHAVISISPREKIVTGTAQPQVTLANAIKLPVPLPPIAEQRRIVAKVDQLMALVDHLETQLAASRSTAKNLLEALVAELTTR